MVYTFSVVRHFFSRTIQLSLFIFTTLTLACVPRLCTHFYFSLPTEKFLRGQGEKNTRAEKDIWKSILGEMEVSLKKSWFNVIVEK